MRQKPGQDRGGDEEDEEVDYNDEDKEEDEEDDEVEVYDDEHEEDDEAAARSG